MVQNAKPPHPPIQHLKPLSPKPNNNNNNNARYTTFRELGLASPRPEVEGFGENITGGGGAADDDGNPESSAQDKEDTGCTKTGRGMEKEKGEGDGRVEGRKGEEGGRQRSGSMRVVEWFVKVVEGVARP